jgi:hypothetical protein
MRAATAGDGRCELRRLGAVVGALALALASTGVALAAAPANDDVANATNLSSFPYVATVEMTEATADGSDPWCDSVTGTVWYRYVATAEQDLTVAVPATESDTRVCVLPDSISAGTYNIIFPSEVRTITLDQGRTYYIELAVMNNAPTATLDLNVAPAAYDMRITLDPTGVADRISGNAIIHGTISCTIAGPADLFIHVVEKAGAKRVADNYSEQLHIDSCGPTSTTWQLFAHSLIAYVPGWASVRIDAYGPGDYDLITAQVRLRARS